MALITDKITEVANGQNPVATTVTSPRVGGGTTLATANLAGWPTNTAVHFATYKIDGAGAKVAGTQIDWKGIVSGTNINSLTRKAGASDGGSAVGDVVMMMPTAYWGQELAEALELEHTNTGTHKDITATSVTATGTVQGTSVISTGDVQLRSTSLETIRSETEFDYVASGGVWSGDAYASTRNASMTAVTCYINGRRGTISAVTARSFTASKDTYVDILNSSGTFSLVYTEVTNNAASPALAANSIRLAIIVTGASNIAAAGSVNQGEETKVLPIASSIPYQTTDSLGNLICPRDPTRKVLGYRQLLASTAASTTSGAQQAILGLSCPVVVPAGRRVRVSMGLGIGVISSGGSGSPVSVAIARGSVSTIVAQANGTTSASAGSAAGLAGNPIGVEVPGSGSFTYLGCYAGSGATTTAIVGGSPISILVELA